MIWGFPGRTSRYMTSYGVELTLDQINPVIDKFGSIALDIMNEEMAKDDEVKILNYSSMKKKSKRLKVR